MPLTNLKEIKRTHWLILLFIGSQSNFSQLILWYMGHFIKIEANSDTFILSSLNFIFQFFVKIRIPRRAQSTQSSRSWINALHKSHLRPGVKKVFFTKQIVKPRVNFLYSFASHWFTRHCLIEYTTKTSNLGVLLNICALVEDI